MWEDTYLNDIWRHGSSDSEMRTIASWVCDHYEKTKTEHKTSCKFKVGDHVRLKAGHAKMIVVKVKGNTIQADYISRKNAGYTGNLKWRSENDYVRFNSIDNTEADEIQEGNTEMKNKLYQTKESTPRFGILLAVNSQGKLVLEMKGSGDVLAFDKADVEVVMPYTFAVKFPNTGTEYHYLGTEGEVEVNDLVMLDSSPIGKFDIARVTAVNTRSESANVVFKGSKILTKRIGG